MLMAGKISSMHVGLIGTATYITGSNSKLLSGELATHLTGRYFEIKMYPFSFKEGLDYKKQHSSDELFNEYVEYGGFPQLFSLNGEDNSNTCMIYLIQYYIMI